MEAVQMHDDKPYTIADSCVLVRLEQKRITTRRRADKMTEARIRQQENDDSLTINRHLFKDGPVRDLLVAIRKAYDDHKAMTVPWVDKGPRLLPSGRFEAYAERMEAHKDNLAALRPAVINDWHTLVHNDITRRSLAGQRSVSITDYPDRWKAAQAFNLEWYCDPVPDSGDFRVDIPDHVKQRTRDRLDMAVEAVRTDLLKRLLDPLHAAAEKLAVPIGEKGAIFRDTLITNMRDAVEQARALNVGNDPDIADLVNDIEAMMSGKQPDALRTQQGAREEAVSQIRAITNRFKPLA